MDAADAAVVTLTGRFYHCCHVRRGQVRALPGDAPTARWIDLQDLPDRIVLWLRATRAARAAVNEWCVFTRAEGLTYAYSRRRLSKQAPARHDMVRLEFDD